MKFLKLALWLPVALVILAVLYMAWFGGRATSLEWKWLTLIVACYVVMFAVPVLFWPSMAGAWTVILLKASGQVN